MTITPVLNGSEARAGTEAYQKVKASVHDRLLQTLDLRAARRMSFDELHRECALQVDRLLNEQQFPLSSPGKARLLTEVMDEIFGLGPLEDFLRDPTVSDILVNGHRTIYVEREGQLSRSQATFRDEAHLMQVIQRIATGAGRRIDEGAPMLDARLVDGSRVNAIIPPLALDGPALSIRRFGTIPIDIRKLLQLETLMPEMATFLEACVRCKINILVSGGTGSGKTTLLNVLSKWIPNDQRVVTIEDAAELQLQGEHVVRLETRPPNIEGKGEVTQRDLLRNSLRMRPDRIIIGEVRSSEAFDMLQAMNTGHDGSMTTVHANNPRDALRRVENMVSMAGLNYPVHAIRQQIASALNVLVHLERVPGGQRKIIKIVEVTGTEGDLIRLSDIFEFVQMGVGKDSHAEGRFEACGVRPQLVDRLKARGVTFPDAMFLHRVLDKTSTEPQG